MSTVIMPSSAAPTTKDPAVSRVDNLPAATVQCHASNLLQLPDQKLLCVWFGGTQEGTDDISIYICRLEPGSSWSEPVRLSSDPIRSEQNPVLFRDPATGTLWLFHTAQPAGNQDQAAIIARTSKDAGQSWSGPFEPCPGKKGAFIRQPIVVLTDKTWVLPIWYCRVPPGFRWIGSDDVSAVAYSKDGGETWNEHGVPDSIGRVHMNIVALPNQDSFVAFYRSRWADNIYRSTSLNGIDWTAPQRTSLPNPNSGICAAALPSGGLVMVFNESSASADMERREGLYDDITSASDQRVNQPEVNGKTAIWGTPRKALTVGISNDEGKTWKCKVLEDGDGFCMTNNSEKRSNRELSYPSVFVDNFAKGGKGVHIAYTHYRQRIKYVHISDVEEFVNS
ncbi:glycosyl hydrolase [Xylariaceae sp. FL0016]|nr:glycosyl hydrolase [Xylariaceae sp. FL0016]